MWPPTSEDERQRTKSLPLNFCPFFELGICKHREACWLASSMWSKTVWAFKSIIGVTAAKSYGRFLIITTSLIFFVNKLQQQSSSSLQMLQIKFDRRLRSWPLHPLLRMALIRAIPSFLPHPFRLPQHQRQRACRPNVMSFWCIERTGTSRY